MSGVNEIRSTFLKFFADNATPSCRRRRWWPRNDPTLMFTNAGMVHSRTSLPASRSVPISAPSLRQKCGARRRQAQHLDNVGYTTRHNTFFEMLGNFSVGDYFKDPPSSWPGILVTREFGLPKDKLTAPFISTTTRPSISGRRSQGSRSPHHPHRGL